MQRKAWLVVGLTCAVVAFHLATIRQGHNWAGDFALYILHARNIVTGHHYADTGYIYNPNFPFLSPPTYPPIFPLILAPVYGALSVNLTAMKVVCILFFGLALLAIFVALRDHLSFRLRILLLAILGFNPFFWDFKDNVLADLPFLFFTYVSLWLIHRLTTDQSIRGGSASWIYGVATGVMMYIAYGTRSVGLIVMACLIVYYGLRSRRVDRYGTAAVGSMSIGIVLQNLTIHQDGRYFDQLFVYFDRTYALLPHLWTTIEHWGSGLALLWDNARFDPATWVLTISISALACVGFVITIRQRGWTIFEVYALFYPAVILLWPMARYTRFLIPIFPLYVGYTLIGSQWSGQMVHNSKVRLGAGSVALLMILCTYVSRYSTLDFGPLPDPVVSPTSNEMFQYVHERTKPSDVMVFAKPRILALMTDRRSASYNVVIDDTLLWGFIHQIGATHLITIDWWRPDQVWFSKFLNRNSPQLELVFENPAHRIFRIRQQDHIVDQ